MLKTMMTANELGIEQWEHDALRVVRDMLLDGRLKHSPEYDERGFNMDSSCVDTGCGAVACIGGWMAILHGMDMYAASDYVHSHAGPSGLDKLFFPSTHDLKYDHYEDITPQQAAMEIDRFLHTGEAWV